jgi:hypothetical protein
MSDLVFPFLLAPATVIVFALWRVLARQQHEIDDLRERNDRTEEAFESYLLPATQTVGMLTDRVRNLENELTRHMEEPHVPLDPGEARRAARDARARQRAIEEDLGG